MSPNRNNKGKKVMSDENTTNINNSKPQKRLIIVTGDKGGVGKSTFARALFQLYINKNLPCVTYEADLRNPQLERYFKKDYRPIIRYIDIFHRGGADDLLINLDESDCPITLLDLPAQSGGFFESYVKELSFFEVLKTDINCQVTMVSVISRVLDSINVLEKLRELCKDQVDYVVVKNLFHGEEEKFERYNDAFLRQNMLAEGLVELVMPDLFYKSYDFIDRHALTFNEGQTHKGTNIVIKSRIKSWLAEFEAQIKPAFNLFGFDIQPDNCYYPAVVEKSKELRENEEKEKAKNQDSNLQSENIAA
ncbi:chromosome partitioning protein ParA [Nostoc sp. UCD121]|nr:chromosome partitioning protein ParA [Nostoc sp. UCD120]MBC1218431.1 chromosome partitioning protein ParA [Nostoc sp. UCD120]MBC1280396.1 chromosome partitioning protein ParA [Nostoc sp. UCD121]MBC1298079.1 chromosome partitioning protein ParA [Nostoc sp. UCD122]